MHLELLHNISKMTWYGLLCAANDFGNLNGAVFLYSLTKFVIFQIVDKIRVQMDAFLEDGSHEATIAVVRALLVAVPHTTERLRDYILNLLKKIQFLDYLFNACGLHCVLAILQMLH